MASRAAWKGSIPLGGMVTLHVEAFKATEKYAGSGGLREVCSCPDPGPFKRTETCPHGKLRSSNGSGTAMQKGAEKPDGKGFVPVSSGTLSAITAAISSDEIVPLALLDETAWPAQTVNDLWYLQPHKKVGNSLEAVAAAYAYLADRKKVLVARWSVEGRQHVVAIHAANGVLCMNRLRYAQEIREPEDTMKAVGKEQVDERMLPMLDVLLEDMPTGFNIAEVQDESVNERQKAIQAALAGELPEVSTPVEAPASTSPDLMSILTAETAKKKGKKAAPAKAKVKA